MPDEMTITALTADQILAVDDRRYEMVEVPEWGGPVRVRSLTSDEWDGVEDAMTRLAAAGGKAANRDAFRSRVAVLGLVDGAGAPLFALEDQAKLGAKGSVAIGRICSTVIKLTQVPAEDVAALTAKLQPAAEATS